MFADARGVAVTAGGALGAAAPEPEEPAHALLFDMVSPAITHGVVLFRFDLHTLPAGWLTDNVAVEADAAGEPAGGGAAVVGEAQALARISP